MGSLKGRALKEKYAIDFFEAMSHSKYFDAAKARKDLVWQYIAQLYSKGMSAQYTITGPSKIPKKFHLIWLGSPPPQRYYILEKRLRELHKDFEIKLWTDHDIARINLVNRDAYQAATNFGEKSDIARYEILYREGGIYLDGDFEIFESFEDLCYAANFFTGIAYDSRMIFYNGLIGSEPGHPILKFCIQEIGRAGSKKDPEAIMDRTGPYHFTRCFWKGAAGYPKTIIPFPVGFFYPWPNYEKSITGKSPHFWRQKYSLAMHVWACSWISFINIK